MSLTGFGVFFPFSTSFFFNFPMLLESFSLLQMTFSTSLYKFYPCLQSWSIYSSMAHITIGHTVISLWILSISLLCAFPPTRVPLPYPEGCLYSSLILLVSLLFFSCLSSWWVGCFCTSHSLKKISLQTLSLNQILFIWYAHRLKFSPEWRSDLPAAGNLFLKNFWGQRPQIGLHRGINFTHKRVTLATA